MGRDVIGLDDQYPFVRLYQWVSSIASLYLGNQWSFKETIEQHLSLNFLRVIAGSLGIVLSIPISVLFFLTVRRLKR